METEEIVIIILASVIFILILGFGLFYAFQMNKRGDELTGLRQERDDVASNYGSLLDRYGDEAEARHKLQSDYDALHREHEQYTGGVTRALNEDVFYRNQSHEEAERQVARDEHRRSMYDPNERNIEI